MEITLKPVNLDNYEDVCELSVSKEQENYVAENMWSIVESKYHPTYEIRAIYSGDKPVGFFMWVPETTKKTSIWRFNFYASFGFQEMGLDEEGKDMLAVLRIR